VERSTRCVRRCAACGQREDPTHSLAVHYDCLTCIGTSLLGCPGGVCTEAQLVHKFMLTPTVPLQPARVSSTAQESSFGLRVSPMHTWQTAIVTRSTWTTTPDTHNVSLLAWTRLWCWVSLAWLCQPLSRLTASHPRPPTRSSISFSRSSKACAGQSCGQEACCQPPRREEACQSRQGWSR